MTPGAGYTRDELALMKAQFVLDAEGLFKSMANECPTCHIPHSRCPECWAYTAKLYLRKLDHIREVERRLNPVRIPTPTSNPGSRMERMTYLVALLRAAGKPIPASDITIPGITHPKHLCKFLTLACDLGYVKRFRVSSAGHRRSYHYSPNLANLP